MLMDRRQLALVSLAFRPKKRKEILSQQGLDQALDEFADDINDILKKEEDVISDSLKVLQGDPEIRWVWFWEAEYPERLRCIPDTPLLLFYKGNLRCLSCSKSLAVVGSRRATSYGRGVTEDLVSHLKGLDVLIVSGGAIGIDASAHRTALRVGLPTAVVLGAGLGRLYPASNVRIFEEVLGEGGILISEFLPAQRASKYTFPIRNRIISGLSDVVVVVEAGQRSGALITARYGAEQGRDVYAVPGAITWPMSCGANRLIRDGAMVFVSVEEFVSEMGWVERTEQNRERRSLNMSEMERCIVDFLVDRGKIGIEELMLGIKGVPYQEVLAYISLLEIKGIVRRDEGDIELV